MIFFSKIQQLLHRKKTVSPQNKHSVVHDLQSIYLEINQKYFNGSIDLSIEWFGRKNTSSRIRRKVLGYYDGRAKRIKIHRSLDSATFPPFFIAYVVYHEMLHHVEPPIKGSKRRQVHHREFKRREKLFESYNIAKIWEKENLRKILYGS